MSKPKRFNLAGSRIEWAHWTWNPVTGCNHGCSYCYARGVTTNPRTSRGFPDGFAPTFYPARLQAPEHTPVPRDIGECPDKQRVFVCSMADLFGDWVPTEWIESVLQAERESWHWTFLHLTKNPARYANFEIPLNAWIGATVDRASNFVDAVGALASTAATVKFVSFEPLLEQIDPVRYGVNLLAENIDWMIIGGCTGPEASQPDERWVDGLELSGLPVFHKSNLACRQGSARRMEFPAAMEDPE